MIKDYVALLVDELFKYIDVSTIDLSDPIVIDKMGKIFCHITTYKGKKMMFNIIKTLNKEQFNVILPHLKTMRPSVLANLLFTCNYIESDDDFILLLKSLNKGITKRQMSSKYYSFYKFKQYTVKSKIPRNVLFKLKPLVRLKVLRALASTKEYPFAEHIQKSDLEASLFPLVFEYKDAIQGFVSNWKW